MTPSKKRIVQALLASMGQTPMQVLRDLPRARSEDDPNSAWDAQNMGNRTGRSFIAMGGDIPGGPDPEFYSVGPRYKDGQVVGDVPMGAGGQEAPMQPRAIQGGAGQAQIRGQQGGDDLTKGAAFGEVITPSGVSEQNNINTAAYAYNALMNSLEKYGGNFQPGPDGEIPNVPFMPGEERDTVSAQRRNIQMQMKELYNLGVLNGPDLMLMDEILFNPLSVGNKLLDVAGIADSEKRAQANIGVVKDMMRDLVEPKLKASGVTVQQVYDSSSMSEEDYLKALGLE